MKLSEKLRLHENIVWTLGDVLSEIDDNTILYEVNGKDEDGNKYIGSVYASKDEDGELKYSYDDIDEYQLIDDDEIENVSSVEAILLEIKSKNIAKEEAESMLMNISKKAIVEYLLKLI